MIRHAPVVLSLLASVPAFAQGITDVRSGIALPNAQGAAVEDATALLVNPAGLAFVEGVELNLGGYSRDLGGTVRGDLDATIAGQLADGLAFGLGSGLALDDARGALWRTSIGLALGEPAAAVGLALHGLATPGTGDDATWTVDLGTQVRPARWLGLGVGLERLGDSASGPASGRAGVSLRPLKELLTLGVDARVTPGSADPRDAAFLSGVTVSPAVVARVDLGGMSVVGGTTIGNIGPGARGGPTVELMASLEVNGAHLGATALGSVAGLEGPGAGGAGGDGAGAGAGGNGDASLAGGGARLRLSSAAWSPLVPQRGRWLALELASDGALAQKGEQSLLARLFADEPPAERVLLALHDAARDPTVDGVLLHLEGLSLGWGRLGELRASLERLRASGKKVVVHLDEGADGDVFVASAADRVYLTPSGALELNGLRAERIYLADALAKLGVRAEAVAAGRYKSAPRQFTANGPSPEELEVEAALLDGAFTALTSMIAAGRGLDRDAVRALIDRGGLSAPEALDAKLVDGLAYADEVSERIEQLTGGPVRLETRVLDRDVRVTRWDAPAHIAVIPVEGTIAMDGGPTLPGETSASAADIVGAINQAAGDSDIRAIVVHIDSPGGDVLASDLMWRAIMKAREKKPVVASMGDVAASGGYYVAAAAHAIWAEPNTITGSIGVFGLLVNAEELADRLGVRVNRTDRGALTGPSLFERLGEPQRAALQRSVDGYYERFLDAVMEGRGPDRGLDKEGLRAVAEGRVWTGAQAHERKLVDALGGVMDALDDARRRAGIAEGEPIVLDIVSEGDGDLSRFASLARALAPPGVDAVAALARLYLGDPAAVRLALSMSGRPLALSPVAVRLRAGGR